MKKQLSSPKICDTFLSRGRGLMFSSKKQCVLDFGKESTVSLHNFFVFFPLHIYTLNASKEIIEIGYLPPFGLYSAKKKGYYVVESPEKLDIDLNDSLKW